MDPLETFKMLMEARSDGCLEEATEHAENLLHWLNRGGFAPELFIAGSPGDPGWPVSGEHAATICRLICQSVLSSPKNEPGIHP